jgi:hypothetical protein
MQSAIITKSIENRVRKGFPRFDSEELLITLLMTKRSLSDLADALVEHQFANDNEDALLAVMA